MKNIITLYHGSNKIIQTLQYGAGKRYNDYGRGFLPHVPDFGICTPV